MDQGVKDQKFVDDFYEVLKKGDEFLEKADPEKIAQVAGKHGMVVGMKMGPDGKPIAFKKDEDGKVVRDRTGIPIQKDEFGRRYDHYGFFDPKHKHYGKTIREVTIAQVNDRKLKDDDFPIEYMINNTPVMQGVDEGLVMGQLTTPEQAKRFVFPLKVIRENETTNKIEQITESLHVKRIDETHRILEFIIPKKFGLSKHDKDSKIVKELIDFKQIWHKEKYGDRYGFTITGLHKIVEIDKYDVIKLKANLIEKVR
jgi:hypothetical protein